MAIDFTKLKPIEEEQEIDSNTSENTGIDFSSLSPVDYDDSPTITPESGYIPTDTTKQYNPETYKAPIRMLDNYTLSEDKMNVIESKYNNSVLQIEKARKNLDNLNLTQDEKDLISGRYDLALDKLKVERIDSIRKEQNEMLKIDKMKGYTPSLSLEERLPQQGEAFVGGFNRMTLGIARLATAPFPDTDGKSQVEEAIVNNQKAIDEALDKAGIPKDQAITPDLAGEIVANIMPLSLISKGVQISKTGISVVEGIIAAIQKYGSTTKEKDKVTGEDTYKPTTELEATTTGLIAGTTSKVGLELADIISKRGTNDAVNYLWNKHSTELREASGLGENATKEEVIGAIEDRWLNIMQGSSSKESKVKSMIDALGEQGAAYKKAVQQITDTELESNVRQPKFSRVQELRDVVEEGNVEAGSKALAKQVGYDPLVTSNRLDEVIAKKGLQGDDATELKNFFQKKLANGDIKNTYSDFINAIKDKYRSEINIESKAIEDLQQSLTERATLSKGLSSAEINISERLSQPMTIDNLLNIKVELNRILRGTNDGLVERNALALRDEVEGILKKTVTPDEFELYKKLETEYALRSSVKSKQETNKIAMNLMEMANGKKTVESVMKDLDTLNTGEFDFKQLEKIIGTKNMAKIETGIVKNLLAGKVDDVSYEVINKSLSNMNFVSKEGKELKSILNEMDTVFKSDNFTTLNNKVLNTSMDNVNALTADLIAKLKYSASSTIFRNFKRKYFQTKEAIEYRNLEEISNILSGKKTYARGIVLNGNRVSEDEVLEVARESIMDSYKQQIKQIKPDVTIDEEQLNDVVNNSMLGMSKNYGGKPTNPKTPREGYEKIEESLYGTKQIDNSGKLGLSSKYGGKATGTGGVNTEESKKQLNKFMDEIANPKVEVKTEKIEELYSMLEADRKTMYAASKDKKEAWEKAMDIVDEIRKNKTVSTKARDQMIKAVQEYYDRIDDTL